MVGPRVVSTSGDEMQARYRGFIADTIRWEGFAHRPDDIVISTPSKSGTTWMQRLVALLVLGPELPAPLGELSPWLDMHLRTPEEAADLLEAQQHRRFIKTHSPLDGLPLHDDVTYLVVGRDPRDAWVSMSHHLDNLDRERLVPLRMQKWGEDDLQEVMSEVQPPEDPVEAFAWQLEQPRGGNHTSARLAHVVHHLADAWCRRDEPNVHLFHYADLSADLPGQLERLAGILGVPIDADRARQLAQHASLDAMRADARNNAPSGQLDVWKDPATFFRRGGSGEWRELVTPEVEDRYDRRVAELTGGDDELAAWIHGGWGALEPRA